jgi:hypothetical protein
MKRRDFLKRSAIAAVGTAAAASGVVKLGYTAVEPGKLTVLDQHEGDTLLKMARQIFPHEQLDDIYYWNVVTDLDHEAATTPVTAQLLHDGVANLDRQQSAQFVTLTPDQQVAELKKIDTGPFFQKVQSTAIVSIYNNHEVWKQFGYPGASYPFGGYIHRGFNDLTWLPDPPASASPKPA